jgi:hypothetical protein
MSLFSSPKISGGAEQGVAWRPLHVSDYEKGYIALLSQLTQAPEISHDMWLQTFETMRKR